ncbi:26S proteasome subunit-like protein [Artemisia annua]|uniref:26S proteasome subunit-like protein n=1 Tax=Artemisia annua TaxID=35608 RepID=A0A2U1MQI4_ARTAN|nr:26S proteasome subunit-like protein [Artemisia annua]
MSCLLFCVVDMILAKFVYSFKLDLAFDLSLSALLGENIYNFGELLAHPITIARPAVPRPVIGFLQHTP